MLFFVLKAIIAYGCVIKNENSHSTHIPRIRLDWIRLPIWGFEAKKDNSKTYCIGYFIGRMQILW